MHLYGFFLRATFMLGKLWHEFIVLGDICSDI